MSLVNSIFAAQCLSYSQCQKFNIDFPLLALDQKCTFSVNNINYCIAKCFSQVEKCDDVKSLARPYLPEEFYYKPVNTQDSFVITDKLLENTAACESNLLDLRSLLN